MTSKDDESRLDNFNAVYWIIFLVGIVSMMPWDMLATVNGYWQYKFRNVSLEEQQVYLISDEINRSPAVGLTKRQKEFESYIAIASSVPSFVVVIGHAIVGNRFSVRGKSLVSLIGVGVTYVGIVILAYLDSDDWATLFLVGNLTLAVVVNVFRALLRATSTANMGKFPVKYVGSLANGVCMGGLIPVIFNVAVLGLDVDIQMAGFACFAFSGSFTLIVLALYLKMETLPFYKHFTEADYDSKETISVNRKTLSEVFNNSWLFLTTATLATTTTALVYPAVASLVKPIDPILGSEWHEVFYDQVTCFLNFNIFNYLGTAVAGLLQWPRKAATSTNSQVTLFLLAVLRFVFVPIFMLCNLAPSDRDLPVMFDNDTFFVILLALFAFSDGYVNNMAMMFAPKAVRPELQEITAGIMVACLSTALGVGSVFSNLVVKAL